MHATKLDKCRRMMWGPQKPQEGVMDPLAAQSSASTKGRPAAPTVNPCAPAAPVFHVSQYHFARQQRPAIWRWPHQKAGFWTPGVKSKEGSLAASQACWCEEQRTYSSVALRSRLCILGTMLGRDVTSLCDTVLMTSTHDTANNMTLFSSVTFNHAKDGGETWPRPLH